MRLPWFSRRSRKPVKSTRVTSRPPRRFRPAVEEFEKRLLLALTVNASGDDNDGGTPSNPYGRDGTLSLREAIELVNANYDSYIKFSVSTVSPTIGLPVINVPVIINGAGVTIDGSRAGVAPGLVFAASANYVTRLTINNFASEQLVFTAGGNSIQGSYIGTNMGGTASVGGVVGVLFDSGSNNNLIGGNGNVIAGNSNFQLVVLGNGNTIQGNFIGCNQGGTAALGGGNGILIEGANNTLGGLTSKEANVISGNPCTTGGPPVVAIHGSGANNNLVVGNFIGTDKGGMNPIGNGGTGISIGQGASNNTVGGTTAAARNIISDNALDAVAMGGVGTNNNLVLGNYMGTDASGTNDAGFGNQLDGVDIYGGASKNTIGGTTGTAANIIADSAHDGVSIYDVDANVSSGNVVAGNFIGTDKNFGLNLGNKGNGVSILDGASRNTIGSSIGGTSPGARNIIANNGAEGVLIQGLNGTGTAQNLVAGNYIGTDPTGKNPLPNTGDGVGIFDAAKNTVGGTTAGARNIISANKGNGVRISGGPSTKNLVAGNYIGTDSTGSVALGNKGNGVQIDSQAASNTIGGSLGITVMGSTISANRQAATGNVISANGMDGVLISDSGTTQNVVMGNDIGTDLNGSMALGNTMHGVAVTDGPSKNTIGGSLGATVSGNVISGNLGDGVLLSGTNTTENLVAGNFIGAKLGAVSIDTTTGAVQAATGLPNGAGTDGMGSGSGVHITNDSKNNTIGGTTAGGGDIGDGNIIAFNKGNGVWVEAGTGNAIRQDLFIDNGGSDQGRPSQSSPSPFLPIALGSDQTNLTPNTPGGQNGGANNLQNYPIVTYDTDTRTIHGTFNGAPGTYTIDVYVNVLATSGQGSPQTLNNAGAVFLGSVTVDTDGLGNVSFAVPFTYPSPIPIAANGATNYDATLTGTATDANGNTSEFGVAFTPAQIRQAYGFNNLHPLDDGTGQTIAIVLPDNDPSLFQDVDRFDQQFGLRSTGPSIYQEYGPASAFLQVYDASGRKIDPSAGPVGPLDSVVHFALDVEWAHVAAPGASIVVVETGPFSRGNLFAGVVRAANLRGSNGNRVSVVAMSFGFPESPNDLQDNSIFARGGVTYVAATGNSGNPGAYPAFSPNVVAVGGTTLNVNGSGSYNSEAGWAKSGGGVSTQEPLPAYQMPFRTDGETRRSIPDVAIIAGTKMALAESVYPHAGDPGWMNVAGTSVAAPLWAGLIAVANQGRARANKPLLNATDPQETLKDLYCLPSSDYHNNLGGDNGAGTKGLKNPRRYNYVTGLGSSRADLVVPGLINGCMITVDDVFTTNSRDLTYDYTVGGMPITQPFIVHVYRSDKNTYDPNDQHQVEIGEQMLSPSDGTVGQHHMMIDYSQFEQDRALRADPSHPYVILTIDDNGMVYPSDAQTPPQGEFHIWLVGVVTHGVVPDGSYQHWVDHMATTLLTLTLPDQNHTPAGYDDVVTFHWEGISRDPHVKVQVAANMLETDFLNAVRGLPNVGAHDVFDAQFIGFSRGAVVIGLALQDLQRSTMPQLRAGYMKMTLLDPHPARNESGRKDYSVSTNGGALLGLYLRYQAIANDGPVVVPGTVRELEDFFQRNVVNPSLPPPENDFNVWGLPRSRFQDSSNLWKDPKIVDYTGNGRIGHNEVIDQYQALLNNPAVYLPFDPFM